MRSVIYINGALIPENEAVISPFNSGFLFGEGLFETIRADNGSPFGLPEHLERMRSGLRQLNLKIPDEFDRITTIIADLLHNNQLLDKSAVIKLICSPTDPGRAISAMTSTSLIIRTTALKLDEIEKRQRGMQALILPWRRNRANPLLKIKSLNYLENRYGLNDARSAGFDEGIFLNQNEELCEGTFSNIFLIRGNDLQTPPLDAGILPGTTRALILQRAQQAGITCQETPLFVNDLKLCDGAFLTSSLMRLAPLAGINQINFNLEKSLPLRHKLLTFFQ